MKQQCITRRVMHCKANLESITHRAMLSRFKFSPDAWLGNPTGNKNLNQAEDLFFRIKGLEKEFGF